MPGEPLTSLRAVGSPELLRTQEATSLSVHFPFWLLPSYPVLHLSLQSEQQVPQSVPEGFSTSLTEPFLKHYIKLPFAIFSNPPLKQESSSSSWGQLCAVHPYVKLIWIISVPEKLYWQKTPDCVKAEYCYKWKSSIRQLHQSTDTQQRQRSICGKSDLLHNPPVKRSVPNLEAFGGHWMSHSQ